MANTDGMFMKVFFVSGLLAFAGLGLWFLFGPPAESDETTGEALERAARADIENGAARDTLRGHLVLARYDLERNPASVSGTVVNNTEYPYVNVQVGFRLYDADSNRVGTARDTTSIVEAGDVWTFHISLPSGQTVAHVEHYDLKGGPKAPPGPAPDTADRSEDAPGAQPESGAGQNGAEQQ